MNDAFYEIELARAQIEHKEPITVWFFISQYRKLPLLDLYFKFQTKFCDVNKFEELEKDTNSLYLARAGKDFENCIRPDMKAEWRRVLSRDCNEHFTADTVRFFTQLCCDKHEKRDKREPGFFKEEFRCAEMLRFSSNTFCCFNVASDKFKFSRKGLNKRVLEQSGDGALDKYRRALVEKIIFTSTDRSFRTGNYTVATFEQVRKRLSCFYPKKI